MPLPWSWLGRIGYAAAVEMMEARRAEVLATGLAAEAILLCEHDPVITLGRSADRAHVLVGREALEASGVTVAESSRGGDVTYHGPGQVMVYPVVRLRRGLIAHLEAVAGVLAEAAAELGAPGAAWRRQPAGLWLGDRKLAACGLHVRRGVAIHGFAFDVSTPPEAWRAIVPCGLGSGITVSLDQAAGGGAPAVAEVAARIGPRLAAVLA
ncbi:MAG TPA: lipoyl(octanoyl) transferase LipB [Kofleriaceae bacterium]|nr:lipoyl(octanoyl) transferase LipB [Kofleriaceae bacterium]